MYPKKVEKNISLILLFALFTFNLSPLLSVTSYAQEVSTTSEALPEEATEPQVLPTLQIENTTEVNTSTPIFPSTSTDSMLGESTSTFMGDMSTTTVDISEIVSSTTLGGVDSIVPVIDMSTTTQDESTPSPEGTTSPTILFTTAGTTTDAVMTVASSTPVGELATSTESADEEGDATGELPVGTTTVSTGEAVAMANILNIVNTNLVNSTGSIIMSNLFDEHTGTLDLRSNTSTPASSSCTLVACSGVESITTTIESDADINNDITLVASSGANTIDTAETAIITTGDTYAGLNLVNVANTNLIDSNYFLLSLNAFKNFNGDIVLPSLANFFSTLYNGGGDTTVDTVQNAEASNTIDVLANAGGNAIEAVDGIIHTGSALSSTNIYNNLNSSLIGGGSVALFLKVSGTWLGELFGAPDGSAFVDDGGVRTLSIEGNTSSGSPRLLLGDITSTSTARISNTGSIIADSGNNQTLDTINSDIGTGNAYASANIITIANSNIIGRNWILAIINIFGDFNGNISFGKPDLWIGEQVSADPVIQNGTQLTYTLTIINKGDSNATNVKVSSVYDKAHLTILDATAPYTEDTTGSLIFSLGTLAPNDAREIIFHATIVDTTPGTAITNTSTVTERESDNNSIDNTDTTTITTTVPVNTSSGGGGGVTIVPTIVPITITPITGISIGQVSSLVSVSRMTASTTIIGAGTQGEQVITIRNTSNTTIPSVIFDDKVSDSNGALIRTEVFTVGDLLPYEEVTLTYGISFGAQVASETFTLSSLLHHSNGQTIPYQNNGTLRYVSLGLAVQNSTSKDIGGGYPLVQPLSSVASVKQATSTLTRVTKKGTVLGAFTESFLPMTAYAGTVGGSEGRPSSNQSPYLFSLLLLSLLISSLYVHSRILGRHGNYAILRKK